MELTTDYYAYEYAIIQKLNDIFNIKSISFNKETQEIYGNLQSTPLFKIDIDNYIQLNFKRKFHYCISRKSLVNAFQENCPADEVVIRLKRIIKNEWSKLIYNEYADNNKYL